MYLVYIIDQIYQLFNKPKKNSFFAYNSDRKKYLVQKKMLI